MEMRKYFEKLFSRDFLSAEKDGLFQDVYWQSLRINVSKRHAKTYNLRGNVSPLMALHIRT